jgi:hypothetical protein
MPSESRLSLIRERISIEMEERTQRFKREVGTIKSEMSARGMLMSGMTQDRISRAIENEMQVRLRLMWQTVARVLSIEGVAVSAELKTQVTSLLADQLDRHMDDLATQHQRTAKMMGTSSALKPLDSMKSFALRKINSEVELSLLEADMSDDPERRKAPVNIYRPVGVVQTGHGSTAALTLNFSHSARDELRDALEEVTQAVRENHDLSERERAHIIDLAEEVGTELESDEPNSPRVVGALSGIGTAIQTLGSAQAAYKALKAAASLVGLQLP